MNDKIRRIIKAHLEAKKGSNYVRPLLTDSESLPYYQEQEQTYTDLSQMDSTHGPSTQNELDQKRYVLPDDSTYNPDWGDGNFLSPKVNQPQRDFNKTPNTPETLYDPAIDGDGVNNLTVQSFFHPDEISELNSRTSSAIDGFLSGNTHNIIKISSNLDLTEFMKVSDDTLIHKSNKDIWKVCRDKSGNAFIKRLMEEDFLKEE
jgi:hypothetical protein